MQPVFADVSKITPKCEAPLKSKPSNATFIFSSPNASHNVSPFDTSIRSFAVTQSPKFPSSTFPDETVSTLKTFPFDDVVTMLYEIV